MQKASNMTDILLPETASPVAEIRPVQKPVAAAPKPSKLAGGATFADLVMPDLPASLLPGVQPATNPGAMPGGFSVPLVEVAAADAQTTETEASPETADQSALLPETPDLPVPPELAPPSARVSPEVHPPLPSNLAPAKPKAPEAPLLKPLADPSGPVPADIPSAATGDMAVEIPPDDMPVANKPPVAAVDSNGLAQQSDAAIQPRPVVAGAVSTEPPPQALDPLRPTADAPPSGRTSPHLPLPAAPDSVRALSVQLQPVISARPEGTIAVMLEPAELGRLHLTFTQSNEHITVQVSAERAETLDFIRRNAAMLEAELHEAGFEGVALDFGRMTSDDNPTHDAEADPDGETETLRETPPNARNYVATASLRHPAEGLDLRF